MSAASDLRLAFRSLTRAPGFAAITILTLALGIGANAAIFSVLKATILEPLPYPKPEQLVFISSQFPGLGFDQFWISPPEFLEFQEHARSFSKVGAFQTAEINLSAPDRPRRVSLGRASGDLFDVLGIVPSAGRGFTPEETRPNGPQATILSTEVWRSAFGSDPSIVGRSVEVGGIPRTVVGIMPPGFDIYDKHVEVWLPLIVDPANRSNRGNHALYLIGRLRDDATLETAKAELETLLRAWPNSLTGGTPPTAGATPGTVHQPTADGHRIRFDRLQDQTIGTARTAVLVLQGAVVLVLLIACANVASLLLARAESRHKEFAVRLALGAGRWALVRPFMAEAVVLALIGGAVGVAIGTFGLQSLLGAFPSGLPRAREVTLDGGVLAFAFLIALISAGLLGLAPLLHLSPKVTEAALKEAGTRTTVGVGRNRARRALVAGEVALAVALIIGAGLLIRTVLNLSRVDSGFNRGQLITFGVAMPPSKYPTGTQLLPLYQRLLDGLRALPGVQGAAAMSGLPPLRQVNANDTTIEGFVPTPNGPSQNVDYYQTVTTDYVPVMGIRLVEGRSFEASDAGGPPVVLINETMARTFYNGTSPLGRRVQPSGAGQIPFYTIVGVLKDVKQGGVDKKVGTELYFNYEQLANSRPAVTPSTMNIVMRASVPVSSLAAQIQQTMGALDSSVPIVRLRSMDEVFDEAISRSRLIANLLGVFAIVAILLAAIGTYGVLSFMVTERRREIGIRMALGAGRDAVRWMVLRQGLTLAFIGLAIGLGLAFAGNRVLTTLLFGVAPTDPATIAIVVAVITAVSAIGCYLPARRATGVDPMIVLRDE